MTDGIAGIGRSPDLSRPVEPFATRRLAEGRGGDDKGGFAALMDRSRGRDIPPKEASGPREDSEAEAAADEAGSSAEDESFEDGSALPATPAPSPGQEARMDVDEGTSAPADMEWADSPDTGDLGAPDPLWGLEDPEAATGTGNATAPETGWPGQGRAVVFLSARSASDMPGSRVDEATGPARWAEAGPEGPSSVVSRQSRAAAGPMPGVAASLLSSLTSQETPGVSAERAWPAAAARVADLLLGPGGSEAAWVPLAPVFAAASSAREGSVFGATAGWPAPAGSAPVVAPPELAAGAPVPAEVRSRSATAAFKGGDDPALTRVAVAADPAEGAGHRSEEAKNSKAAGRLAIDSSGSLETAKAASPFVAGLRSREGRRLVGVEEGGLDAPALAAPPGGGLATSLVGPEAPSDTRRILQQVATHPVLRTGGSAELSLAPEELGPLRLTVEMDEAGLRILIEAARPETADLMRRHVEALRQELRQEGLGSVGVSIGGGEGRPGRDSPPDRGRGDGWATPSRGAIAGAEPTAPLESRPRTAHVAGHIDLRF